MLFNPRPIQTISQFSQKDTGQKHPHPHPSIPHTTTSSSSQHTHTHTRNARPPPTTTTHTPTSSHPPPLPFPSTIIHPPSHPSPSPIPARLACSVFPVPPTLPARCGDAAKPHFHDWTFVALLILSTSLNHWPLAVRLPEISCDRLPIRSHRLPCTIEHQLASTRLAKLQVKSTLNPAARTNLRDPPTIHQKSLEYQETNLDSRRVLLFRCAAPAKLHRKTRPRTKQQRFFLACLAPSKTINFPRLVSISSSLGRP